MLLEKRGVQCARRLEQRRLPIIFRARLMYLLERPPTRLPATPQGRLHLCQVCSLADDEINTLHDIKLFDEALLLLECVQPSLCCFADQLCWRHFDRWTLTGKAER